MNSESDQSDGDYIPGKEESVSEEGSADEETDLQFENEQITKNQRKKREGGKLKTRNRKIPRKEKSRDEGEDEVKSKDSAADKEHEDQLWASFLSDTSSSRPKASTTRNTTSGVNTTVTSVTSNVIKQKETVGTKDRDSENREKRIFDFAGEKIVIDKGNKIIEEKTENADSDAPPKFSRKPGGGGLSNILSQIGKKNKLSTLEKSKLDWENFKSKEGISEELNTHNKGKDGYLERQDFLERADLRRFEIEKNLRANRKSFR